MEKFTQLLKKLQEPSTMKGMIIIAGLLGVQIDPAKQNEIIAGAVALYSLIQIFVSKD